MSADNHAKPDDDKGEPHENDKCMDDGHQRRPNEGMSKLRAQVTSAVANIPSLVIVLLCVLLLVFFVIIIALAVQVHSSGSSEPSRCLTATCLATAAGVLGSLDARADPCVEPYALACDGAPSPLAGHRSRLDAQARLRHSVHHRLRHLVDLVPPQAPERSAASKVKRFYETCMEPRGLTPNALAVFVHMARQAGGWDLIRTSAWSMQSWDRDTTLEKLIVDLGVTPFFRITVASPDVSVIRVSAPFLFARSPRSYSRNDKGAGLAVPSQPGWLPCSSSNDDSWSSRTRARTRMLAWRRLGHFTSQCVFICILRRADRQAQLDDRHRLLPCPTVPQKRRQFVARRDPPD